MRALHRRARLPITFIGDVALAFGRALSMGWRFRLADFLRVLSDCSWRAVFIICVVNFLVGAILAFVGAVQLSKLGAGIYVADLVGIAVAREMASIITAVVIAGRTGAAFAAEIASMHANEEIDALHVLGLRAIDFLVLPRVICLMMTMPMLYAFAFLTGILGGMAVSAAMLDISPAAYLHRSQEALAWTHLLLGAGKSLAFGFLISMVGTYHGLYSARNAAGVGVATTGAVVTSIVGIIILDALFAICANALGI